MNSKRTIVLVDDDIDDHEIFGLAMSEAAPEVQTVYYDSAEVALESLLSGVVVPDFIFLDLNMPRMNGIQLLQMLKQNAATANLRVIIYSTTILADVRQQLEELGAYYFFIKPFSHLDLISVLRDILSGKEISSGNSEASL